jgi:hypothetical protein
MKSTFKQKTAVQKIAAISTLVLIAVIGFSMAACGDGKAGDGQPEIQNTFYIGKGTQGQWENYFFYIGTANTNTSSDTPDYVYSMPGLETVLGAENDNTPGWKSAIERYLSLYQIKKNGILVSYSDLPDYSGPGEWKNRMQHWVFALR